VQDWWRAEQYIPDGIVPGSGLYEEVMKPLAKANAHYPYGGLDALTGGIREQEMVVVTAGSGLGKSQFLREVIWSLLSQTTDNIGLMFLEESVRKTGLSIMSLAINKPLHLAETVASDDDKQRNVDDKMGSNRADGAKTIDVDVTSCPHETEDREEITMLADQEMPLGPNAEQGDPIEVTFEINENGQFEGIFKDVKSGNTQVIKLLVSPDVGTPPDLDDFLV
jgi:hypothetical protein